MGDQHHGASRQSSCAVQAGWSLSVDVCQVYMAARQVRRLQMLTACCYWCILKTSSSTSIQASSWVECRLTSLGQATHVMGTWAGPTQTAALCCKMTQGALACTDIMLALGPGRPHLGQDSRLSTWSLSCQSASTFNLRHRFRSHAHPTLEAASRHARVHGHRLAVSSGRSYLEVRQDSRLSTWSSSCQSASSRLRSITSTSSL